MTVSEKSTLAYIIGCSLGDGNLSSPNGRVPRLRITCDSKYPQLADEISKGLRALFPRNKVSVVLRRNERCFDMSVYSKALEIYMPWKAGFGSKIEQQAHVPEWIMEDRLFIQSCLRGLIQTDGCIYNDRGYMMVNFVNNCFLLAADAYRMLISLGYRPRLNRLRLSNGTFKYTVKVARKSEVSRLIEELHLYKS